MTCVVGLIVINCENDLISDVLGETHVCRIKRRLLLTFMMSQVYFLTPL